MKSTVTPSTPKSKYPYIGISNLDIIILFTSPGKGVQIGHKSYKLGGDKEIGDYATSIAEENFKPFDGVVTLSN